MLTKVHKIVLCFVDHDDLGAKRAAELFEQTRYPNHIIPPSVEACETREVDWSDDHPLNYKDKRSEAFEDLFK
jgi:hypothetical protein